MLKRYFSVLFIVVLAVIVLAGCSGNQNASSEVTPKEGSNTQQPTPSENETNVSDNNEEIELSVYVYYTPIDTEKFEQLIKAPVEEKFPHITLTRAEGNAQELLTAGQFPDIVFTANSRVWLFTGMDIPVDMTRYIEKYNVDLNRFEQNNFNFIRKIGKNGEVYGLPLIFNKLVLYYNKELFDNFGVEYPVDGMTYDEVLELTREFSRVVDGIQYRGIIAPGVNALARQRSLQIIDPETYEAKIDTDEMKSLLQLTKAFYDIPGILENNAVPHRNAFLQDQTAAMYLGWILPVKTDWEFDWDVVTQPVFEDRPNISMDNGATQMMLSSTSQHPDEAFQVINYIVSDEMQTLLTRKAYLTTLDNPSIRQQFLADYPELSDKNILNAVSTIGAEMAIPTPYDGIIIAKTKEMEAKLAQGTEDINSILRAAEEEANIEIKAQIGN